MSFLRQNASIMRPGSGMIFQAWNSNPDPSGAFSVQHQAPWPLPILLCPPCLVVQQPKDPQPHSANPINKELRKFIRKWAFYRFCESLLPTSVTEKG